MKDKSKKLLVINTGKKGASTASDTSGSSASFKGGSPMALNMSEYLLKAIWNKAFEIKTDERGNEYLFSKLPLATQYGITMYADGGELNLPDIYAGIPFDNKSIWYNPETKQVEVLGGNGSSGEGGVSNFWDLNGIPGWITITKPTYNYSEIKNTPDLSEFVSSDDLKKYVSLDGNETINGLKNFTKGLQIDGLGITKLQDDVVYLDAHLVVRGGITMFGTGEDVDVPTIMDALSVDGVNLQVINGVLTFVGEATGGVADSVRWENVIGRPTLLSSFTDDVVAGKYLPLSGGTISGTEALPITISNNINDGEFQVGIRLLNPNKTNTNGNTNGTAQFGYSKSNGVYMFNYDNYNYYNCAIGITDDGIAYVGKGGSIGTKYKIWHEGNDGSGSGLDADLLDGLDSSAFFQSKGRFWSTYINSVLGNGALWTAEYTPVTGAYNYGTILNFRTDGRQTQFYITDGQQAKGTGGRIFFRDSWNAQETMTSRWLEIITNENIGSQTVSKANQLTNARTIWGQSFDGAGNVDGDLTMGNTISPTKIKSFVSENEAYTTIGGEEMPLIINNSTGGISLWRGDNNRQLSFGRQGSIEFRATTAGGWASSFGIKTNGGQSLGNVCGAYGNAGVMTYTYYGGSYDKPNMVILPNGNVGIGTTSPSSKLDIKGGVSAQSYGGYNGNTNTSSSYRWAIYQWNNELQITRRDSSNTYLSTMLGFDLQSGNVGISVPVTPFGEFTLSTLKSKSHFCLHHNNVFGVYMMVDYNSGAFAIQSGYQNRAKALDISLQPRGGKVGIGTLAPSCSLHVVGDILSTGGITMYSDQRKKTILNHVELSLKQIADAPLIEHYYNSDESKTTHVGSIAQYWAEMNDWFCKLDNEGFYTMEIQNAALASAISIARELVKYESKTDKKIRLLKKRIGELEEEIEKIKTA